MADQQDFELEFGAIFRPVFLRGFGALILALTVWIFYLEISTGSGPSMLYTLLPIAVSMAVVWAVLSVMITLIVIAIKKRLKR